MTRSFAAMASLPLAAAMMWATMPAAHAWQTLPSRSEILPPNIPQRWQHVPPKAPVWETYVSVAAIPGFCHLAAVEKMRWYGCAKLQSGICLVYVADGMTPAQTAAVVLHERAHCAGWLHGVND